MSRRRTLPIRLRISLCTPLASSSSNRQQLLIKERLAARRAVAPLCARHRRYLGTVRSALIGRCVASRGSWRVRGVGARELRHLRVSRTRGGYVCGVGTHQRRAGHRVVAIPRVRIAVAPISKRNTANGDMRNERQGKEGSSS